MTKEELKKVEDLVNAEIQAALPVKTDIMTLEEARRPVRWLFLERNMVILSVLYRWAIFEGALWWYACEEYTGDRPV